MIIGKWNKSVILTYVGLTISLIGTFISITNPSLIKFAVIALMFAGICDLFDGAVARKCKRTEEEKAFGVEIDSLVDVFCFIAFPVVLLTAMGLNKWYDIIVFVLYVIFGIARLGYFNISTADSSKSFDYYTGLPVTAVALVFPLMYLFKLCLNEFALNIVLTITTLLIAILFVLKIKIKKPRGVAYIFFGALAIAMTIIYCLIF